MKSAGKLLLHGIQPEFLVQEDGKGPKGFSAGPVIIGKKHPGSQVDLVLKISVIMATKVKVISLSN